MKFTASCKDRNGKPARLIVKADTREKAVERLYKAYGVQEVVELFPFVPTVAGLKVDQDEAADTLRNKQLSYTYQKRHSRKKLYV